MFPFCVLRIFCVDGVCAVSHHHSAVHNNTNTNLHHYLQFLAPTKKNINKYKHFITAISLIFCTLTTTLRL